MSLTRTTARPGGFNLSGKLRSVDPMLLLVSVALSVAGIFAVYFAVYGHGSETRQYYATNQAIGFFVGLAGAIPLALFDYRILKRHLRLVYVLVLVMLLAVTIAGAAAGGAQRWIDIGPVQVQPSEFAKLFMVVVLAGFFSEVYVGDHINFLKGLGIVCLPALLVFMQPDLGTALVFGAIFFTMSFIAGARISQLALLTVVGISSFALAVKLKFLEPYQVARLTAFLNPNSGSTDAGYQVAQSKTAIGSGGLTGKGLMNATTLSNLDFLPEDHTDFIFSNLAERIGFVGCLVLLLLFFLLVWRILHVATISRDRFGVLIAVGIATIFLFHVFVNIGMTMGIMPVTGIPLPFISYGRSSLVVSIISLGLLQSIAMHSRSEGAKRPSL